MTQSALYLLVFGSCDQEAGAAGLGLLKHPEAQLLNSDQLSILKLRSGVSLPAEDLMVLMLQTLSDQQRLKLTVLQTQRSTWKPANKTHLSAHKHRNIDLLLQVNKVNEGGAKLRRKSLK